MGGLKPTCLWLLFSLTATALAHPDSELRSLHLTNDIEKREPGISALEKRCTGTCSECFGDGYIECASSSYLCYKPGDALHGEESCSSSGTTNDVPVPTVPALPPVPTFGDFCEGSCSTCFGAEYEQCPSSALLCYKPGDSVHGLDSCTSGTDTDSSSSSSSGSGSSSSSSGFNSTTTDYCDNGSLDCGRCFGGSYTACPDSTQTSLTKYCYDPNNSTSICPGDEGSAGGSVGGGVGGGSGSSSGGSATLSGSTTSYTASSFSRSTSTGSSDALSSATGAGGGINVQSSATSTSTGSRTSSATGGSQTSSTSGNADSSPISANASGQPSMREGMFGLLAVIALCFTTSVGLVV